MGIRKKFLWGSVIPNLSRLVTSPARASSLCPRSTGLNKALSCFTVGRHGSAEDSRRRTPCPCESHSGPPSLDTISLHPIFDSSAFGTGAQDWPVKVLLQLWATLVFSVLLTCSFNTALLELLLSVNEEPSFAFLGQQHHLQPAPTWAVHFCLRERTSSFHPQLRKERDKNNLHVLGWKREVVGLNSTSGAREANRQSYTAGVLC